MRLAATSLLAALIICSASVGYAATIHVPADQPTIQAGIDAAVDGDTVLLATGVYSTSGGNNMPTVIDKPITLMGAGDSSQTVLDGEDLYRVIFVAAGVGPVYIKQLTVKLGTTEYSVPAYGAGIMTSNGANVYLTSCVIDSCWGIYGAGVYAGPGATFSAVDCNFTANHRCDKGGGIYLDQVSSADIERCHFTNDTANWGGGVYVVAGQDSVRITECYFEQCRGPHGGGVCFVQETPAAVRDCKFVECTAVFNNKYGGGAIDCEGASPLIEGNVIDRCWGDEAAGIRLLNSNAVLAHNTIVGSHGSAIGVIGPGSPIIRDNILSSSEAWGIANFAAANQLQISHCCAWDNLLGDFEGNILADSTVVYADPQFCDPTSQDYSLALASPCVGAGTLGSIIGALGVGCRPLYVDSLEVGSSGDNYHVLEHYPTLHFSYIDSAQQAIDSFEVAVGSDDDWSIAETWEPLPFAGPDTSIIYSGNPLLDSVTYYVRLRISNGLLWSDWYETSFRMNSLPAIPTQVSPVSFGEISSNPPTFTAVVGSDAESDSQQLRFAIYMDDTILVQESALLPIAPAFEGDTIAWTASSPLTENWFYFWSARAWDGFEITPQFGSMEFFLVNAIEEPPAVTTLLAPQGDPILYTQHPDFVWVPAIDPDPNDSVWYDLRIAQDSGFVIGAEIDSLRDTSHTVTFPLETGRRYWWKVISRDNHGLTAESSVATFRTYTPGDVNLSGNITTADIIELINFVFKGSFLLVPDCAADANGTGSVTSADVIHLVGFVFKGGAAPVAGCL